MIEAENPTPVHPRRLKVIYGWYIYTIYSLLIFNIYLAVYNFCARHPYEAPLISTAHSLFIAFLLIQILKKRVFFSWLLLGYFMLMRLYYANILHVEFNTFSLSLVMAILTLLLAGTVVIGQYGRSAMQQQEWLAIFGWRQWAMLTGLAALLTLLITRNYLG